MTTLRRAAPGDNFSIRASTWNAFVKAAELAENVDTGAGFIPNGRQNGRILVYNDTGADLDARFPIVGIDGLMVGATENATNFFSGRKTYKGIAPTTEKQFAVCVRPVLAGKIVEAYLFGASIVRLNDQDESHDFATIAATDPEKRLDSAESGESRILYRDGAAVEEKWAVVLHGYGFGGGGAAGSFQLFQATADAANGEVAGKNLEFKSNLAAVPNVDQVGDAYNVAHIVTA